MSGSTLIVILPVSLFPDLVEKNNYNDTSKENYKALLQAEKSLALMPSRSALHV